MDFLLEPGVVFLNHGSFGACPREVHDEYQRLQRRLEAQPVRFLQRELPDLLRLARAELARFVGSDERDVVFVPNPTFAVNEIARSLELTADDEVLMSDHEYGACRNAWLFLAPKAGFSIVEAPVPLPVASNEEIVERLWAGVTDRTRVMFLSHITSPTALTVPVAEVCRRARRRGIITVIDGAHVPGQLDLDVTAVGADFYVATCHKWICAPKGSAFFHARREVQHLIEPLVVGWGWGDDRQFNRGSDFLDFHEWLGTDDPSAYLTVPTAIAFQQANDWPSVRSQCHGLAVEAVSRAAELPGVEPVHPPEMFAQMALVELAGNAAASRDDPQAIQARLYREHRIEVPVVSWNGRRFVRASFQAYNTADDVDALVTGLRAVTA